MIYMQEALFHQLRDDYSGICTACAHVKCGDTEPDARNYKCANDACRKSKVQGIENLLLMGLISFEIADDQKPYAKYKSGTIRELVW